MLARNSLLNAAGMALPLALGFFLLPVLTRELGPERFGLLALAWALLEYMGIFDVGIGRATTRLVAEALVRDPSRVTPIVARALAMQAALGTLGAVLLMVATPLLVARVLEPPPAMAAEARAMFLLTALAVPVVLVGNGLRNVVEAAQRFDLATMVRVPASTVTYAVPALAAWMGASLPEIMALLLGARVITLAVLGLVARRAVPTLRFERPRAWHEARATLAFGGWLTFSNLANPVFLYFDRFVLAAVAGVAAVGFYTSPFEITFRALLIPVGFVGALFPNVSAALATDARLRVTRLYGMSLRYVALAMLPVSGVLAATAPELLRAWLGPEFAAHSATALRILAVGLFANALAQIPTTFLHAFGRPDLCAKGHAAELVVHVPLTIALVHRFGIAGAAGAWSLRVIADAAYLLVATQRAVGLAPVSALAGRTASVLLTLGALFVGLGAAVAIGPETPRGLGVGAAALAGYALLAWRFVLDASERAALLALLPRVRTGNASRSGA